MRYDRNTVDAFFALVRAGLWGGGNPDMRIDGTTDWEEVYRLATEQSVLGLILAGLEHSDVKPPRMDLLQWIGEVQIVEKQNKAMNDFAVEMFRRLHEAEIEAVLIKGQGVAQSYERPLWRASGDIDLLMDVDNYERAKHLLVPIANEVEEEDKRKLHLGIHVRDFLIELHGRMPFELSKRVDRVVDEVIGLATTNHTNLLDTLIGVRVPRTDEHVIIVFTHFLHHFFIEGVGLRQICDWCRLLWTYKDSMNYGLLESRIMRMGLMTEWKVFAALAVDVLGMPQDAMPLFNDNHNDNKRYRRKAKRVLSRILKSGNMGHNNDLNYRAKYSGMTYKIVAALRRLRDFASLIPVFPLDAPRFYVTYVFGKVK